MVRAEGGMGDVSGGSFLGRDDSTPVGARDATATTPASPLTALPDGDSDTGGEACWRDCDWLGPRDRGGDGCVAAASRSPAVLPTPSPIAESGATAAAPTAADVVTGGSPGSVGGAVVSNRGGWMGSPAITCEAAIASRWLRARDGRFSDGGWMPPNCCDGVGGSADAGGGALGDIMVDIGEPSVFTVVGESSAAWGVRGASRTDDRADRTFLLFDLSRFDDCDDVARREEWPLAVAAGRRPNSSNITIATAANRSGKLAGSFAEGP